MFKFRSEPDEAIHDSPFIEISTHCYTDLPTMLDLFEKFLRASGFHFEGKIEIVEEEEGA